MTKDRKHLQFNGFRYRKQAAFKKSIDWVCENNVNVSANKDVKPCTARCSTDDQGAIKLSRQKHNHAR